MNPPDCLDLYADAEFYDAEFAAREHELPFFQRHAGLANGPVLEVACGTGRLTLPLARSGLDVTGLDVSGPMLELARRKSAEAGLKIEWHEQDCRAMRFERKFALIFTATNAMQHLLDLDSISAFLRGARELLRPGGQLLLDIFNPVPSKLARPAAVRYLHKQFPLATGEVVNVEAASHYDALTQVLHFALDYHVGDRVVRTKQVQMRCFFPEELLALLHWNGLEVVHRCGDYDETPFRGTSPKQLVWCRATPSP